MAHKITQALSRCSCIELQKYINKRQPSTKTYYIYYGSLYLTAGNYFTGGATASLQDGRRLLPTL